MIHQQSFTVITRGREIQEITTQVAAVVDGGGCRQGIIQVFLHHTSASLMLCENADPSVRRDLEAFMARLIPDGDARFEHDTEGPDDMPAHIRTVLTHSSLSVPLSEGRCRLGTWQGIYLWEHRYQSHRRQLTVTVIGE